MKKVLLLIAFLVLSCKNDEINHPNILFIMSVNTVKNLPDINNQPELLPIAKMQKCISY